MGRLEPDGMIRSGWRCCMGAPEPASLDPIAGIAALEASGQWPQALAQLRHALLRGAIAPDAAVLHRLGRLLQRLGRLQQAREAYLAALGLDAARPSTCNNLALLELAQLNGTAAESWVLRGLALPRLSSDEADLLRATACDVYLFLLRPQQALTFVEQQLEHQVSVMALANRAICCHKLGRLEQALQCQQQALALQLQQQAPQLLATPPLALVGRPLADLQQTLQLQLQLMNLGLYRLLLNPDDREAQQLLLAGTAADAASWMEPQRGSTLWRGQPVSDLILWDDQGFGDSIQNLSWLPQAAALAQRLRLWMRPPLLALVRERMPLPANVSLEPMDAAAQPWQAAPQQLGLYFLPLVLKALPGRQGPVRAAWLRRTQCLGAAPRRRLGLVWSAGRHKAPQPERSARVRDVPFEQLWPHAQSWARQHGLALISLQLDGHEHPVVAQQIEAGSLQRGLSSPDWLATARVLEDLDLLVTVDTSVAHLAGALGVPCVVLLSFPADWRWGQSGETTSLYESFRLARCDSLDDWASALRKADRHIDALLRRP
jgi:tetratricopeptide (TPR) repeat protein